MRGLFIGGTALVGMFVTGLAQAQQRLPRECQQEIVKLCGTDRSKIRACLREKRSELSEKCASELRKRIEQRRTNGSSKQARQAPQNFDAVIFGSDPRQAIDFYRPTMPNGTSNAPPPLVLFIHGGGWQIGDRARSNHAKPAHFQQAGYAYASTGYRLVPDVKVEDQAADVAAAIAKLRADAPKLGFDPDRIILMGHSAGAHLAALVATDPTYAGKDMEAIKGVVLLDGAGYDVVTSMETAGPRSKQIYEPAFSTDTARQAALSPATYAGAPDAQNWLILHVSDRARARAQSEMLAAKLREAGASAESVAIPNTDHRRMNTELGTDNMATQKVDAFIAGLSE